MSADEQQQGDQEEMPAGAEPAPGTPVSVRAERGARMTPAEAVRDMRINVPARGNRTLRDVVDRVNRDDSIKALWHAANVNAVARMQINDHSWVHIQIVTNIGLKLLRELKRAGIEPGMVTDYSMRQEDAEVVVALGCLTHCLGMAIHRHGHEEMSLFLAADRLPGLLEGLYEEPERTIVVAEVLQTIISHRSDGQPLSLEAGIVRVADALDMAKGRSRIPFETGRVSIHSLSAAAIEEVVIRGGKDGKVLVEIEMNNSAGLFQVDNLLRSKLRGSGLEDYIEVAATLEGETEKRLLPSFRL
ncbi:MAG TPA: HD domain-containing protein [Gaiellales bacterium]|jgi:metal-dependent HD superfamily phosphatase/phosphodiesterase|nr:HD domain-containing protein [Gaiellales bacterium]HEX2588125.1 HD domain-containing protein [Gaiellales bacterium]